MTESHGDKIKRSILDAGLTVWPDVTWRSVAAVTGLTHPAIGYHFPNNTLKDAVAQHAIDTENVGVIRQMIVSEHPLSAGLDRAKWFKGI